MASEALELALALYRAPIQRHALRGMELPQDIGVVIQLASAPQPLLSDVAGEVNETEANVVEAARFYLQQALFQPDADAYRMLGVREDTTQERIREHYRWLQRWLHPDRRGEDWEASLATRVNWAWGHLRNDAARRAYGTECMHANAQDSSTARTFAPLPTVRWKTISPKRRLSKWSKRIALGISFGSCLGLLYLVLTQRDPILPDGAVIPTSRPSNSFATSKILPQAASAAATPTIDAPAAPAAVPPPGLHAPEQSVKEVQPTTIRASTLEARSIPVPVVTTADAPAAAATKLRPSIVVASNDPVADRARDVASEVRKPDVKVALTTPGTIKGPIVTALADLQSKSVKESFDKPSSVTASGTLDDVALRPLGSTNSATESPSAPAAQEVLQNKAVLVAPAVNVLHSSESFAEREADTPAPSGGAISRIDLARERIKQLSLYLGRFNTPSPPVWDDTNDEMQAEQQRNALHERTQLQAAGDFEVNTLTWRMSENAAEVSAIYNLHRGRDVSESGHLALNMVWREKMWLLTRVELDPTR